MLSRRGQSVLEYTIIVGIVTVVLYYMGTSIKRGAQSLIKVTADQVGNQQNSDQDFNDAQQGYMVSSNSLTDDIKNKEVVETGYIPVSGIPVYTANTTYRDRSYTISNVITNGGFSQTN